MIDKKCRKSLKYKEKTGRCCINSAHYRSHNRMTFIDAAQRDKVKIDENGKKTIILPNGIEMIDATRFAWDRDDVVVHPALKLSIQYKMLEDIYSLLNEKIEETEKVRHL